MVVMYRAGNVFAISACVGSSKSVDSFHDVIDAIELHVTKQSSFITSCVSLSLKPGHR